MSWHTNGRILMLVAGLLAIYVETVAADRVEAQRTWTERFVVTTAEPQLEVCNIWGDVRVTAGAEGEITLLISEHRSAPDRALFERSRQVYGLDIRADGQGVDVRVGGCGQGWHGKNPCRRCRVDYQFEIQVPPNAKVHASTVNDGSVEISGVAGPLSATNVNGPITIHQARACDSVDSVNGDVFLGFSVVPERDCDIETINGDIRLQVPGGSGLDLALNLGNGRVTSEIPVNPLAIPARVEQTESGGRNHYRIEQAAGVRLADGGPVFSVTSMNGDLRIQELK